LYALAIGRMLLNEDIGWRYRAWKESTVPTIFFSILVLLLTTAAFSAPVTPGQVACANLSSNQ
jgi:hypothetical protein